MMTSLFDADQTTPSSSFSCRTRGSVARMAWLTALAGLISSGCFDPQYNEGIECSEHGTCPGGMICDPVDNRCRFDVLDASCDDGVQNGDETDIDCGGGCAGCADGQACGTPADCMSQVCEGGTCQVPRCGDGAINDATETCDDAGESTACDSDCTAASCGDGTLNATAGEACDDAGESAACDSDCTLPMCGDGVRNSSAGEVCDDAGPSPVCNADCTSAACGDQVVNPEAGEECDDGGETTTCDDNCTLAMCGDGTLNMTSGEQCDDSGESAVCDVDCTVALCGDGTVNMTSGEVCDTAGDSAVCDADCTAPMCGDSYPNTAAGEECDAGGETAACDVDCTIAVCGDAVTNTSAGETCDTGGNSATCDADCTAPACGDGLANLPAGEECDTIGDSAVCDGDCTLPVCGDSYLNTAAGEECDTGVETAVCDVDCTFAVCGDAVTNTSAGETCDTGGNSATCDADCTFPACGDGVANPAAGELCDDGNNVDGDGCSGACLIEGCVWDPASFPINIASAHPAGNIAFHQSCDLLVMSYDRNLYRVDFLTRAVSLLASLPGSWTGAVVHRAADGLIYVGDSNGTLYSVTDAGVVSPVLSVSGSFTSLNVAPPSFGSYGGQLIATMGLANTVVAIDLAGPTVTVIGTGTGTLSDGEFAPDGTLYVVSHDGRLSRVSPTGTFTLIASGFSGPDGVTVDPTSTRVYVAASNNSTLYEVTIPGGVTTAIGSYAFNGGWAPSPLLHDAGSTLITGSGSTMVLQALTPP